MNRALLLIAGLILSLSAHAVPAPSTPVPATLKLWVSCGDINGPTNPFDSSTFFLQTVIKTTGQIYGNPLVQDTYKLSLNGDQLSILPKAGGQIVVGRVMNFPSQCYADQETTWADVDVDPALEINAEFSGAAVQVMISKDGAPLITLQN